MEDYAYGDMRTEGSACRACQRRGLVNRTALITGVLAGLALTAINLAGVIVALGIVAN